jgi:hypothetical protein
LAKQHKLHENYENIIETGQVICDLMMAWVFKKKWQNKTSYSNQYEEHGNFVIQRDAMELGKCVFFPI